MPVIKRCRTCGKFKALTEDNFDRSSRPGCTWSGWCRACTPCETVAGREDRLIREEMGRVLLTIRRYEALRDTPGREREAAYNAMALALRRHGRRVDDGERCWAWDEAIGEVVSNLIRREWRASSDPHADPRRVLGDELRRAVTDVVEVPS